jgi:hypothetical protein
MPPYSPSERGVPQNSAKSCGSGCVDVARDFTAVRTDSPAPNLTRRASRELTQIGGQSYVAVLGFGLQRGANVLVKPDGDRSVYRGVPLR